MDLLEAIECVLKRSGVPSDRARRAVDAVAAASAREQVEHLLLNRPSAQRCVLARFDGWARVEKQELVLQVEAVHALEDRYPLEGRTPLVSGRQKVLAGDRLTEGEVAPGDLLEIFGPRTATDALKAALKPLVALPPEDLDLLIEPMFSLVALASIGDSGPSPAAPRLSFAAFDALMASPPPDMQRLVGHPVVTGYDLLARHVDPPLESLRRDAPGARNAAARAEPASTAELPVARGPDGSFTVRTEGCREHGHREVALRWSLEQVPSCDVTGIARYLVETVRQGTRYEPGQTLLIGGHLTRFTLDGEDLTLEELDYTPPGTGWKPGIDQTMWEFATQRFTAESYGLLDVIEFARGDHLILMCKDARPGPFLLNRTQPAAEGESGWFLGCGDLAHNHRGEGVLVKMRIHELIARRPALTPFLALPRETIVLLRSLDFQVLYDEARRYPEEGSFIAAKLQRAKHGDFELGADILALISAGKSEEAEGLICERFLCNSLIASDKINAVQRASIELKRAAVDEGALAAELARLLKAGSKLEAIAHCRDVLVMGLADAKRYVEALEARLKMRN